MRDLIAILISIGAIQGFALCLYLFFKKKENKRAFNFYLLFLFCISFFNLLYALKFLEIFRIGFIPLDSFPLPYKYLIGVGFYFYVKSRFDKAKTTHLRMDHLLFLPAILYGFLRTYWYVMLHSGMDEDIFWKVYKSGFFIYNEYVYLTFNLILTGLIIRFLRTKKNEIEGVHVGRKNWKWLLRFSWAFLFITIINLTLAIIVHVVGDKYNGIVYSILLILNSAYIYWVGFESLNNSKFLFNSFSMKQHNPKKLSISDATMQRLQYLMTNEEVFTNKNLKISDLADLLRIRDKELSLFIHESFGVSFSEYINHLRVEKVKELLHKGEQDTYTLLAIAEKAGFNSKSSFNAVFKKVTNLTPKQYRDALKR